MPETRYIGMGPDERRRAGEAVGNRMRELGLTVSELARMTQLDQRTIRRIISGETWPREETRQRIVASLGMSPGQLARQIWSTKMALTEVPTEELARELCKRLVGHEVSARGI